jgi:hypothetical protein
MTQAACWLDPGVSITETMVITKSWGSAWSVRTLVSRMEWASMWVSVVPSNTPFQVRMQNTEENEETPSMALSTPGAVPRRMRVALKASTAQ